mgnify:CR=1 FL=1
MKTELKNCLSLYKIFYSCAFILILCAIHPIIYYEEIGEYSRAMKSHFRKFGNQMSGSGNHLCNYASLLA